MRDVQEYLPRQAVTFIYTFTSLFVTNSHLGDSKLSSGVDTFLAGELLIAFDFSPCDFFRN